MLDGLKKIWNNDNLYGHFFTTLPNKMWDFAIPDRLVTYTKPEPGTEKRIFLIFENYTAIERHPNGNINTIEFGTNFLLFKYSEIGFRLVVGTFLTAGATITAAPLGFAIKIIHNTFA